jgi:hypothetical protein
MASDSEKRKLVDLRVVDLRAELERRNLDKTGVKAVLIERLQKVIDMLHELMCFVILGFLGVSSGVASICMFCILS